jgi:membrane protease YdiL (CAAX protease family)
MNESKENREKNKFWFKEKSESFLNFYTPAVVAALFGSLQFVVHFFSAAILFLVPLVTDLVIIRLLVLIISQLFGSAIIFFIAIPLFKVKHKEFKPLNSKNLRISFAICCIFWTFMIANTIGIFIFSTVLNVKIECSIIRLPLSSEHINNLFNIMICFLSLTVGMAVFAEYLFRRMLIPLLEERGMSSFAAVISSGLVFASSGTLYYLVLRYVSFNDGLLTLSRYDLWNTLSIVLSQFWLLLLLGMACGIVYILTRNIAFSISLHALVNTFFLLIDLFVLIDNDILLIVLGLISIIINIIGLFLVAYTLWKNKQVSINVEWLNILKEKSQTNIKRGFLGYILIFLLISSFFTITPLSSQSPILLAVLFHLGGLIYFTWVLKFKTTMVSSASPDSSELSGDM